MSASSSSAFEQWLAQTHGVDGTAATAMTDIVDRVIVPHHLQSLLFQITACYGQLAGLESQTTPGVLDDPSEERQRLFRQADDLFDRLAAVTAQCERVAQQ